jgi:hypothetical protein
MAPRARMLGAWIHINNPNRTTKEDLNLTVGGAVVLNTEALRLLGGNLLRIRIDVKDEDTFSDDLLLTDQSFQLGIQDTTPRCFHVGIIVPYQKLNDCEPFWDSWAEVYCNVSGRGGGIQTNTARTQTEKVAID